jgi:hypothetical protein
MLLLRNSNRRRRMSVEMLLILAIAGAVVVYFSVTAGRAYRRFRGKRLIVCPETEQPAAVEVDAGHAAITGLVGLSDLRLSECTRWPERAGCGQECLRQIEQAPENCLVRNVVAKWFNEKACALCGNRLGLVESWGKQLALLAPDGVTHEWGALPPEHLPELFVTHKPVCWNCHIAEQFRRMNPELITDRPAHSAVH